MGKKVNPKVMRLNITRTWTSKWFSVGKDYSHKLEQDVKVKRFLLKEISFSSNNIVIADNESPLRYMSERLTI